MCTDSTAAPQAHVTDWLAAFAAHPRIGDLNQLKAKYSQFAKLSETEQASAATASGDVLQVHFGSQSLLLPCNYCCLAAGITAVSPTGIEVIQ